MDDLAKLTNNRGRRYVNSQISYVDEWRDSARKEWFYGAPSVEFIESYDEAATVGEGHQMRSSLRSSEVEGGEGGELRSSRMSSLGSSEVDDASYREVAQGELLDELRRASEEGRTVRVYRTMQVIDGKLYSPMAKKVAGEETSEIKFRWEAAEEHPELAKRGDGSRGMPNEDTFYIKIDKGQGKGALTVAYNPYTHTSRTVLNDQFSSAFARPNLVVVEVEVPESELTSLYKAERAKDSVGEIAWHRGTVSGKLV